MPPILKQSTAVILSVFILSMTYLGSYLPLHKSQLYIDSLLAFQKGKISSLEEFNNLYRPAFDFYSPVGQDEITSSFLGGLLNLISQQNNKEVVDALIKEVEKRAEPELKLERGFNFSQTLYVIALIYRTAAIKFNDDNYYQKSIEIFTKASELSPYRSTSIYGLFDLYVAKGDLIKAKEVGKEILKYWPNDEEVRGLVEQ